MAHAPVFVTGRTGYLGSALIAALVVRGHAVHALTGEASAAKVPRQASIVIGDALDADSFAGAVPNGAAMVHLVGTPHPNPAKTAEFRRVDLGSIRATADAAKRAFASHLIYVSVAHPAPVMRAYIEARVAGEALVRASGVPATILRPWYVVGPGHRWPVVLEPMYALLRTIPATRAGAERLGLVTREQMVSTLIEAVVRPPPGTLRIVEVPEIRRS